MLKKIEKSRLLERVSLIVVVSVALVAGGALGAVASSARPLAAPAGVSGDEFTRTVPKSEPTWSVNSQGLTYGSAYDATSPDTEPDLIAAIATNGREGYVLKVELDEASGANMPNPEAAIEWTNNGAKLDHVVNVYALDGTTVIGEFVVYGTDGSRD